MGRLGDYNRGAKHAYACTIVQRVHRNGGRFVHAGADRDTGAIVYTLASPNVRTDAVKWRLRRLKSDGELRPLPAAPKPVLHKQAYQRAASKMATKARRTMKLAEAAAGNTQG